MQTLPEPIAADPAAAGRTAPRASSAADVEIVVPVFNEERDLAASIYKLHSFLSRRMPFTWQITIADNASTDLTPEIARALTAKLEHVELLRLEQKGRGRALAAAWSRSRARVVAYMDADLSTDLRGLLPLIAPLLSGHSEVAIGSRLAHGARVTRGARREFISRSYNRILRMALGVKFSDAQCGFKAVRADALPELLAGIRDESWFFDTELLVLAQRLGMRIHEVAVDWVEDPRSSVDVVSTALDDLLGIARLSLAAPVVRFAAIGVLSTLAYALLFLALAGAIGSSWASAVALGLTGLGNTAANRRLTFGVRGRDGAARQYLAGLIVFSIALALTSGALSLLHGLDPRAPRLLEMSVLVLAASVATVTRYVALSSWIFRARPRVRRNPLISIPTGGSR